MARVSDVIRLILSALVAAALVAPVPALARPGDPALGVWRNKRNSIHLKAHYCGEAMCGTVVWANEKALADARKGGSPDLIGMQLFRDFRPDKKGVWRGKVFVPDLNKTFSGTASMPDRNTLIGKGCLAGGLFCKSKTLIRVR